MTMRITQGTAGRRTWEVTADTGAPIIDWDGWTAVAQARTTPDDVEVLFEWSTTDATVELLSATFDPNTEDLLEHARLRLITPADASVNWTPGTFVYDVALSNPQGEVVARISQDNLVVTVAVTR